MILSLGKVTVTTAGTPERVTKGQTDPNADVLVYSFLIEALPSNTGNVYIGVKSNMNKTTLAGVVAILPIPTSNLIPSFAATVTNLPHNENLNRLYIDVDVSGEGVLISAVLA